MPQPSHERHGSTASTRRRAKAWRLLTDSGPGRIVLAMMAVWVIIGMTNRPEDAQDALPFVVAGDLLGTASDDIYIERDGSLFDLDPSFRQRSCEIYASAADCDEFAVAYVSPPTALPLSAALSWLPTAVALKLFVLATAGCMVAAMLALWLRLAEASPKAPAILAATAVLLTPMALVPIGLGQTSPLMFLSAALGVVAMDRPGWRRAVFVGLLTAVIAIKLLPVVLLGVLVVQRRWRPVLWTSGVLAACTVVGLWLGADGSLIREYLESSEALQAQTALNPYNGAIDAFLYRIADGALDVDAAATLGNGLRILALVPLAVVGLRLRRHDSQWAFAWAGLMLLVPLAWWHYGLVSVAAVGVALGARARTDRAMLWLPGLVIIGLPLSVANSRGWAVPVAQFAWMLLAFVVTTALLWPEVRHSGDRADPLEVEVPLA